MSTRTITVDMDEMGNPTITTTGFTGGDCLKATLELEKALGSTVQDLKTPEFYKRHQQTTQQTQQGRLKAKS